jgi:hypothetical protein
MTDVKQAIYNTIHRLFEIRDEDERSINASVALWLADMKEDFPEIYNEVVEVRYCKQHDI